MSNKEENRKLSKAEERRINAFNQLSQELERNGYSKSDLTTTVLKANVAGVLYGLIVAVPFVVLFFVFNRNLRLSLDEKFFIHWLIFFVMMFLLIVVHELIHGFTWGLFARNHYKSIEFGVIWRMLTPYCTCKEPLKKGQYILGALMPCIVLGIVPCIISWFNHNLWFLAMGCIMILSAGGDLLICKMILQNKTKSTAVYLDHPTNVGLAVFEK